MIRVAVSGACGNMGQEVCRAVLGEEDMQLVAAVDLQKSGQPLGRLLGEPRVSLTVNENLREALREAAPHVVVDFTSPLSVMANIETSLKEKVPVVVGTTGISEADLALIEGWVKEAGTGAVIAPNFALGAVLMMELAAIASRFFDQVEIIELHHEQKIDAPSGTALKTAARIRESRGSLPPGEGGIKEIEKLPGARGGSQDGIHIHSVRLPGLVAHQEVIFGGLGQTFTLRHDSLSRKSFMPGVLLAIRHVIGSKDLVYGLEKLIQI
jgi:4-hydroxy-tetrahydrodipicolinate reductase